MWIKRILYSLLGVRKASDLDEDLKHITIPKFIALFVTLNVVFISTIILIINLL